MGERPFHHGDKAPSGLPIRAIREKLSSRFGPGPASFRFEPARHTTTPDDVRRPATLRPRPICVLAEPELVPAGATLLSRLTSLIDTARRMRQSATSANTLPDVASAAEACVRDVQERVALVRDAIDFSQSHSAPGNHAIRKVLDAQRELADAQFTLAQAQRELIDAGHALLHVTEHREDMAVALPGGLHSSLAKDVARAKSH